MDSRPLRLRRRRQKRPHRFLLKTKENHIVHAINCIFYFATKAIKRIYRAATSKKRSYTIAAALQILFTGSMGNSTDAERGFISVVYSMQFPWKQKVLFAI